MRLKNERVIMCFGIGESQIEKDTDKISLARCKVNKEIESFFSNHNFESSCLL